MLPTKAKRFWKRFIQSLLQNYVDSIYKSKFSLAQIYRPSLIPWLINMNVEYSTKPNHIWDMMKSWITQMREFEYEMAKK